MNFDLLKEFKRLRVKQWEVAELLGISEATFSRKLRKELSEEEKKQILEKVKVGIANDNK